MATDYDLCPDAYVSVMRVCLRYVDDCHTRLIAQLMVVPVCLHAGAPGTTDGYDLTARALYAAGVRV